MSTGFRKTAFVYALALLVMGPGMLIIAARQLPEALVPFALLIAGSAFAFWDPLSRLWSQHAVRKRLLVMGAASLIAAIVLELVRHTNGPFIALVLLVLLPGSAVMVYMLIRIKRLAWSDDRDGP